MTDKLTLYNKACVHLEERDLVSLSEPREPRRVLDRIYADVVAYCLGQGLWGFAKRVVMLDASASVTPAFGWNSAFQVPDDWVRTILLSSVPEMDPPLRRYTESGGYWFASVAPLYVSYVSSDPAYGMNLGKWPASFTEYVGLRLARIACRRIAGKADLKNELEKEEDRARRIAKGNDAMNDPPGQIPVSDLVRSRRGGFGPGTFGRGGE